MAIQIPDKATIKVVGTTTLTLDRAIIKVVGTAIQIPDKAIIKVVKTAILTLGRVTERVRAINRPNA